MRRSLSLAEDLELPLSFRDLCVDAFKVDARAKQMSMCSSTILRAIAPTFL